MKFLENIFGKDLGGDSESSGFDIKVDSMGVGFVLPVKDLKNLETGNGDELAIHQFIHLRMLAEEGEVEEIVNGFYMKSKDIVRLDENSRYLLTLPESWIGSFRLEINGVSTQKNFKLRVIPIAPSGKEYPSYRLDGPFLHISEEQRYLPDTSQWQALDNSRSHELLPDSEKTEYKNLFHIHGIIQAEKDGLQIDLGPFRDIDTHSPDKIHLSIKEEEDESLTLIPSYGDGTPPEDLLLTLGQVREGSTAESLRVNHNIILLDEEILEKTHEIIRNRKVPKELRKQFFDNPAAFLDVDKIDLDVGFSFRVKGIGTYEHGYIGSGDSSGIGWYEREGFDSDKILDSRNIFENIKTIVSDLESFEGLKKVIQDAISTGADHCRYESRYGKFVIDLAEPDEIYNQLNALENDLIKKRHDVSDDQWDLQGAVGDGKGKQEILIKANDKVVSYGLSGEQSPDRDLRYDGPINFEKYRRTPYPHQKDAIRWFLGLALNQEQITKHEQMRTGALLADDMGLGKTYSSLVGVAEYLEVLSRRGKSKKPVMVVAPVSLLEIWRREVDATFKDNPFNSIVTLHSGSDLLEFKVPRAGPETVQPFFDSGSDAEFDREKLASHIRFSLKVGIRHGDSRLDMPGRLVLTNYQTLRSFQFSLCYIDWSVVIFDEAHSIKNPNALQTRASKALKADFKFLLTGTPVENELVDLWCQVDTFQPGFLGSYQEFRNEYVKPILKASFEELNQVRNSVGENLRNRVGGYMLRRLKEDQLEGLPKKTIILGSGEAGDNFRFDAKISRVMNGIQLQRYNEVIQSVIHEMEYEDGRGAALKGLHRLRNVTLHPDLLDNRVMPIPKNKDEALAYLGQSGKLELLVSILEEIQQRNEKVLIFLINKRLQQMLSFAISKAFGIKVDIINGDTKPTASGKNNNTGKGIIDKFQDSVGFGVLVMSPIAAGVGLSVTSANNVIHLERHWNPAKEAQATDRVYRIGQNKDVNVYIPILLHPALDSFDVNLNKLLSSKELLKDAVVTPDEVQVFEFVRAGVFGAKKEDAGRPLVPSDVDSLSWELFEALVAEIYSKEADEVILTQLQNDKGCDVVVISKKNGNKLVQCKHTHSNKSLNAESPFQEIISAKPFYEKHFKQKFVLLEVFTNSKRITKKARDAADVCKVEVKGHSELQQLLKSHDISMVDLLRRDGNRFSFS